jgi:uncharacterized protein YecA (UPF0149 family)
MKQGLLRLVLEEMEKGNNPSTICKKYKLNKKSVQNVVDKLKKKGVIKKVGYGKWEVNKEVLFNLRQLLLTTPSFQIRGHAFNWKIEFLREIDWLKRLTKFKVSYKVVGRNKIPRVIINGKKIWLTKKGLVIYESRDFFAKNSFSSKGRAVYELDKTIKKLGRMLQIDLTPYKFTTLREHYALIKNELARQYNNKGEKLYIKDDGKFWMWIDNSMGEHELESNEVMLNKKIQDWYNDQKKTKFEVTPTFLLQILNGHNSQIGQIAQNQEIFDKNISLHQAVLEDIRDAINELKEQYERRQKK